MLDPAILRIIGPRPVPPEMRDCLDDEDYDRKMAAYRAAGQAWAERLYDLYAQVRENIPRGLDFGMTGLPRGYKVDSDGNVTPLPGAERLE